MGIGRVGGREGGGGVQLAQNRKSNHTPEGGVGWGGVGVVGGKKYADEGRQGLGPTRGEKNNMPTKGVRV